MSKKILSEKEYGPGSEIPEPVNKGSTKRPADKEGGDMTADKLDSSITKANMIAQIVSSLAAKNKASVETHYNKMMEELEEEEIEDFVESIFDQIENDEETDEIQKESFKTFFESILGVEDVEDGEINEISKQGLRNYKRKAYDSLRGVDDAMHGEYSRARSGKSFDAKALVDAARKVRNRNRGMDLADVKLDRIWDKEGEKAKKESLSDFAADLIEEVINESELNEISKSTLASYIKKASRGNVARTSTLTTLKGLTKGEKADMTKKIASRQLGINKAADRLTKESFDEAFASFELDESLKEKLITVFESAVNLAVATRATEIEEIYEEKMQEEASCLKEEIEEGIERYMEYVASEWVNENKVAIEHNARVVMAESFLEGLHDLFMEHHIDIPEEKVNVVESLAEKVDELETELNNAITATAKLVEENETLKMKITLDESVVGLTVSQQEKLKQLAETIDFDTIDEFKSKIEILKENVVKKTPQSSVLSEAKTNETSGSVVDPGIQAVLEYARRTKK